ncbi:hypothetical protein ACFLSQ_07480 [Bacteroidota bacterium]
MGGCFPVQYNIPFGKLYHQTIKIMLGTLSIVSIIKIVRYERFANCLRKIENLHQISPFDYLVFHLRAEPLMRLSKFLYKYIDFNGKLKYSFNLPFLKVINPEKYDLLDLRRTSLERTEWSDRPAFYRTLRKLNYILGSLIGNRKYAVVKYLQLISEIQTFCLENGIKLILVGPASRPYCKYENSLSKKIHHTFSNEAKLNDILYLNIMGRIDENGNSMFFENGIHVSQAGHDKIGKLIFDKIKEIESF